jgi:hypothetical protein
MGKIGVFAEKAPLFSSSCIHESMPMNKIGQRLFEINEVCVFIIKIVAQIFVEGMNITEADH